MNPWMSDTEIAKIEKYLDPKYTFLEWGSGGSTLYFSKLIYKYISIEHDINWYNQIKLEIQNNNLSNVNYLYCSPDNPIVLPVWEGRTEDFISYINMIDDVPIEKYDIVLIDGRCRVECAKKILNYIDKSSIVFIHDFFNRPKYFSVLDDYDLIDSIRNGQSLAVLKKKS
jgi:hypothetical protein